MKNATSTSTSTSTSTLQERIISACKEAFSSGKFSNISHWTEEILRAKITLWGNKSVAGALASLGKDSELFAKNDPRVVGSLPISLQAKAKAKAKPLKPSRGKK